MSSSARPVVSVPGALPRPAWELQADILCPLPLTQILHPPNPFDLQRASAADSAALRVEPGLIAIPQRNVAEFVP